MVQENPIKYRKIKRKDIPDCKAIVEKNWGSVVAQEAEWELKEQFDFNSQWPPEWYVATFEGRVVGFSGYKLTWMMSGVWEFIWINVDPGFQGQSIGYLLTELRIDDVRKRGGSAILLMTKIPNFFKQFGFLSVDTMDGWVLMRLQLAPLVLGVSHD